VGLAVNHVWEQRGFRLPRPVAWLLTMLFVMACWVLFRAPDFTTAGQVLASMAGAHGVGSVPLNTDPVRAMAIGAVVATVGLTSQGFALTALKPRTWIAVPAGIGLAYLVLLIGGRLPNVFIYFQF